MSDLTPNVPALTIEAQVAAAVAKAVPALMPAITAELAKAQAARSAAWHAMIAHIGYRAAYLGLGAIGGYLLRSFV